MHGGAPSGRGEPAAVDQRDIAPREGAAGVGFEPTEPRGSTVFKTARFDRSRTPPRTHCALARLRRVVDERSTGLEIPLAGGDVTHGVVRVGDTVRRPRGPWSDAVAAYLLHLERVGFRGAPRYLGVDEHGRDVLEFVCGEVPDVLREYGAPERVNA